MKKYIILALIVMKQFQVNAQSSNANLIQYLFNKYQTNPAYAGYKDCSNVSLSARSSNYGNLTSPDYISLSTDMPFMPNYGFGFNISSENQGIVNSLKANVACRYAFDLDFESQVIVGASIGAISDKLLKNQYVNFNKNQLGTNSFGLVGELGVVYENEDYSFSLAIPLSQKNVSISNSYLANTPNVKAICSFFNHLDDNNTVMPILNVNYYSAGNQTQFVAGAEYMYKNQIGLISMVDVTNKLFNSGIKYCSIRGWSAIFGFSEKPSSMQQNSNGVMELSLNYTY